ncbi:symmetrical bis(5'-nucleosyl)-tetraphosphatase [Shewanella sp. YIC-542]|uniref:symmetrical bis(5'-nucleosyl)-tetraphosphatase n=1 Tax=Shewanella mytili TaxID=3377111 RepID=UPI00398E3DBA
MSNYFVGDIHGCFRELKKLLNEVDFNPSRDVLWSVGDLIARGPESLATLRFFERLDNAARVVLGNHELNLFGIHAGLRSPRPSCQLTELLQSDDLPRLLQWLRQQPLLQEMPEQQLLMTHAGIPPQWDIHTLRQEAQRVSEALQRPDYLQTVISHMYTDAPEGWQPQQDERTLIRYCINALTRIRFLYLDGRLDFACKLPPDDCNVPNLKPWFRFPSHTDNFTKVFGHWAALMGETGNPHIRALDTGCCWDQYLTLWHLESDQKVTQKRLKRN